MTVSITQPAAQLAKSEAGREAARHLLALLDGPPLDSSNQHAVVSLFVAAHNGAAGSVRDALREICTTNKETP